MKDNCAKRVGRWARLLAASCLSLLIGCGGGKTLEPGAQSFVASIAAQFAPAATRDTAVQRAHRVSTPAAPPLAIDEALWFDWLERSFSAAFRPGTDTEIVDYQGQTFRVRRYPKAQASVGLTADGRVFAVASFTGGRLEPYGELAQYLCAVKGQACADTATSRRPFWAWAGRVSASPSP